MRVYLSEMGETRCGTCLITTKPKGTHLRDALRGWEMLTAEQAHCLETDLAVSLVEDQAFHHWGMGTVEAVLMDVATAHYCDTCGVRLDGRHGRAAWVADQVVREGKGGTASQEG